MTCYGCDWYTIKKVQNDYPNGGRVLECHHLCWRDAGGYEVRVITLDTDAPPACVHRYVTQERN